jgi:nucleotide-binding universal stress UspA family protein
MAQFQHILFPVDFSERCRAARPFVTSIAQKFGSKVTLLHVFELPQGIYAGMDAAYPISIDLEAMQLDGERQLRGFFEPADLSLIPGGIATIAEAGEPAGIIADQAVSNGVDLVMMPTHGYGRFRSLLLGSVTAKVLYDVACPVWTAAHTEDPALPEHARCEKILCAVDLTPDDVPTLQRAAELAGVMKARLRLVHAVPDAEPQPRDFDESFRRSRREWAREELAKLQREAGTDLEACVESGPVPALVRAVALDHKADLVVIGRGKLHRTLGRLRTNAYGIIRDSPCPVLSF